MSLSDPNISAIFNTARIEVESFIEDEGNPSKAFDKLNSLIDVLRESREAMESHFASIELKPGDPGSGEVEKVMQAIHEIENFGMQTKNVQDKVNALNVTFFWEKLKSFKDDLTRLSNRKWKRGERVEKVERVSKSRKASDEKDR